MHSGSSTSAPAIVTVTPRKRPRKGSSESESESDNTALLSASAFKRARKASEKPISAAQTQLNEMELTAEELGFSKLVDAEIAAKKNAKAKALCPLRLNDLLKDSEKKAEEITYIINRLLKIHQLKYQAFYTGKKTLKQINTMISSGLKTILIGPTKGLKRHLVVPIAEESVLGQKGHVSNPVLLTAIVNNHWEVVDTIFHYLPSAHYIMLHELLNSAASYETLDDFINRYGKNLVAFNKDITDEIVFCLKNVMNGKTINNEMLIKFELLLVQSKNFGLTFNLNKITNNLMPFFYIKKLAGDKFTPPEKDPRQVYLHILTLLFKHTNLELQSSQILENAMLTSQSSNDFICERALNIFTEHGAKLRSINLDPTSPFYYSDTIIKRLNLLIYYGYHDEFKLELEKITAAKPDFCALLAAKPLTTAPQVDAALAAPSSALPELKRGPVPLAGPPPAQFRPIAPAPLHGAAAIMEAHAAVVAAIVAAAPAKAEGKEEKKATRRRKVKALPVPEATMPTFPNHNLVYSIAKFMHQCKDDLAYVDKLFDVLAYLVEKQPCFFDNKEALHLLVATLQNLDARINRLNQAEKNKALEAIHERIIILLQLLSIPRENSRILEDLVSTCFSPLELKESEDPTTYHLFEQFIALQNQENLVRIIEELTKQADWKSINDILIKTKFVALAKENIETEGKEEKAERKDPADNKALKLLNNLAVTIVKLMNKNPTSEFSHLLKTLDNVGAIPHPEILLCLNLKMLQQDASGCWLLYNVMLTTKVDPEKLEEAKLEGENFNFFDTLIAESKKIPLLNERAKFPRVIESLRAQPKFRPFIEKAIAKYDLKHRAEKQRFRPKNTHESAIHRSSAECAIKLYNRHLLPRYKTDDPLTTVANKFQVTQTILADIKKYIKTKRDEMFDSRKDEVFDAIAAMLRDRFTGHPVDILPASDFALNPYLTAERYLETVDLDDFTESISKKTLLDALCSIWLAIEYFPEEKDKEEKRKLIIQTLAQIQREYARKTLGCRLITRNKMPDLGTIPMNTFLRVKEPNSLFYIYLEQKPGENELTPHSKKITALLPLAAFDLEMKIDPASPEEVTSRIFSLSEVMKVGKITGIHHKPIFEDSAGCAGGAFNALIASLDKMHPDVNIEMLTLTECSDVLRNFYNQKIKDLLTGKNKDGREDPGNKKIKDPEELIKLILEDKKDEALPEQFIESYRKEFFYYVANDLRAGDALIAHFELLFGMREDMFAAAQYDAIKDLVTERKIINFYNVKIYNLHPREMKELINHIHTDSSKALPPHFINEYKAAFLAYAKRELNADAALIKQLKALLEMRTTIFLADRFQAIENFEKQQPANALDDLLTVHDAAPDLPAAPLAFDFLNDDDAPAAAPASPLHAAAGVEWEEKAEDPDPEPMPFVDMDQREDAPLLGAIPAVAPAEDIDDPAPLPEAEAAPAAAAEEGIDDPAHLPEALPAVVAEQEGMDDELDEMLEDVAGAFDDGGNNNQENNVQPDPIPAVAAPIIRLATPPATQTRFTLWAPVAPRIVAEEAKPAAAAAPPVAAALIQLAAPAAPPSPTHHLWAQLDRKEDGKKNGVAADLSGLGAPKPK